MRVPYCVSVDTAADLVHRWVDTGSGPGTARSAGPDRFRVPPQARFAISDLDYAAPLLLAGASPCVHPATDRTRDMTCTVGPASLTLTPPSPPTPSS